MDRLRWAWVACVIGLGSGCHSQDAVLLSVSADGPVEQYQLFVHDDDTGSLAYASGFAAVSSPGEPPLDLTQSKLKLALKLSRGGHFKLLLVGVNGALDADGRPGANATVLFWADKVKVDGAEHLDAQLVTLQAGEDSDGDYWPDAQAFLARPEGDQRYRDKGFLLDCDDKLDNPAGGDGKPIALKAAQINPFAAEVCEDGDHDVKGHDCDDSDPKRHRPTTADPYPDPPNCCGYSLGFIGGADEHKS